MMTTKKGWTCLRWISRAYDRYQASSGPNGKINMLPTLVRLPSASDGPPRLKASQSYDKKSFSNVATEADLDIY